MKAVPGLTVTVPDGAFYVFPGCQALIGKSTPKGARIASDLDLCKYFLEDFGVALVPGSAFDLPGHFRISYAASDAELEEGVRRIAAACSALK